MIASSLLFRLSGMFFTSRCQWLLIVVVIVDLSAMLQSTCAARRNIVLVVADDQGQDAGCYGNHVIQTPHLDALAADGTRFTHAFCTTASCSASRSVILTGIHNHANGHYGHAHRYHKFSSYADVPTLPVKLAEVGYRTAIVGKHHVLPETTYAFQIRPKVDSRNTVMMAEAARSTIEADDDRPFFLYFCTSDPHRGGGVVEDNPLLPDRFGNVTEGYEGVSSVVYEPQHVIVPSFLPDTDVCRAELAQYYQSVSRVDQGFGRLIQILKAAGKYEDSLIIYISDHGIAFPGAKTNLYEPGMRSPCIVRTPDVEARGLVSNAMLSWVDLTPTILDFADALPSPADSDRSSEKSRFRIQGRSFLSIVGATRPDGWDEVYGSHTFHEITMYYPMRVVRERRFKLIWNLAYQLPYPFASDLWKAPTWQRQYQQGLDAKYGKRSVKDYIYRAQFELYDLQDDPDETQNLAGHPKHMATLERLKGKLRTFQRNTQDPWILKWDYE